MAKRDIDRPIFIIGSGRSGTTIFYKLMATHPQLCWFSHLSNINPGVNMVPLSHRLLDTPFLKKAIKRRVWRINWRFTPSEGDNIYHAYSGFRDDVRSTEQDYDPDVDRRFREVVQRHLSLTGKPRFMTKQTANTQRIRLMAKLFPDAIFVHIIRDGRAVANSMINVDWWNDIPIWWLGQTPREWEAEGKDPIELCAMHWERDVKEILDNRDVFGDRYMEIRYEDLIADVHSTLNDVTLFCQLKPFGTYLSALPETLPDMNRKWATDLSEQQQQVMIGAMETTLKELGYW